VAAQISALGGKCFIHLATALIFTLNPYNDLPHKYNLFQISTAVMEIPSTPEEPAVKARPQAILGDLGTTYLLTYNIDKHETFDENEFLGKKQDWASAVIALRQPQNPLHDCKEYKVLFRFKLFMNIDDAITEIYAIAGDKPISSQM
jgi:hypothetical protein